MRLRPFCVKWLDQLYIYIAMVIIIQNSAVVIFILYINSAMVR